jgi:hypothetical protein
LVVYKAPVVSAGAFCISAFVAGVA